MERPWKTKIRSRLKKREIANLSRFFLHLSRISSSRNQIHPREADAAQSNTFKVHISNSIPRTKRKLVATPKKEEDSPDLSPIFGNPSSLCHMARYYRAFFRVTAAQWHVTTCHLERNSLQINPPRTR